MPDLSLATERAEVDAPLIAWMAMWSAIVLASRHPEFRRAPEVAKAFDQIIPQLEQLLRESGFMTDAEIAEAHEADAAHAAYEQGRADAAIELTEMPVAELVAQIGNLARDAGVTGAHMIRLGMLVGQLAGAAGAGVPR